MGCSRVPDDFNAPQRLAYGTVANETMRLRPVAPVLYMQTNVDTELGYLKLEAGTTVAALTRKPALDAEHFENPRAFLCDSGRGPRTRVMVTA